MNYSLEVMLMVLLFCLYYQVTLLLPLLYLLTPFIPKTVSYVPQYFGNIAILIILLISGLEDRNLLVIALFMLLNTLGIPKSECFLVPMAFLATIPIYPNIDKMYQCLQSLLYLFLLAILPLFNKKHYVILALTVEFIILLLNMEVVLYALSQMKLVLLWVFMVAIGVPLIYYVKDRFSKMIIRKMFHILGSLIFITGILYNQMLLNFAFILILSLFIAIEVSRQSLGFLDKFFLPFTDERDVNCIVSHMTLLCGLGLPPLVSWLTYNNDLLFKMIGVLTVGIGDTTAGIAGKRYGKVKFPGRQKTFEGAFANFAVSSTIAMLFTGNVKSIPLLFVCAMYEGYTEYNDNLMVPLLGMFLHHLI